MTIEIIEGDLLNSNEAVIAHGCNVFGVMGAGIAGQIAKRWPEVLLENKKMGTNFHPGYAQPVHLGIENPLVFNLATQDAPGRNARYDWVHLAFRNMAEWLVHHDYHRVAIPQIGCGIGGLQWGIVNDVIEDAASFVQLKTRFDVVCYVYTP